MRKTLLSATLGLLFLFAFAGCGTTGEDQSNTPTVTSEAALPTLTTWVPPTALAGTPIPGAEATLTAAPQLRRDTLSIVNNKGETVNMTVEIADDNASRQLGLMFRSSLPENGGMLFDFGGDTTGSFWMANTILPLSIAFIQSDGVILDIRDMQPLDQTSVGASGPYRYALEANQGFFAAHGIAPGDKVALPGAQSIVMPGMPVLCVK